MNMSRRVVVSCWSLGLVLFGVALTGCDRKSAELGKDAAQKAAPSAGPKAPVGSSVVTPEPVRRAPAIPVALSETRSLSAEEYQAVRVKVFERLKRYKPEALATFRTLMPGSKFHPNGARIRCQDLKECAEAGRCAGYGFQECQPATAESCRDGNECAQEGLCSVTEGRCVAASNADCERSLGCRVLGQCSAQGGECVAEATSACSGLRGNPICRASDACEARDGLCVLRGELNCAEQPVCESLGRCSKTALGCEARTKEDCRQICAERGLCEPSRGQCVATAQADCDKSSACVDDGPCVLSGGECLTKGAQELKGKSGAPRGGNIFDIDEWLERQASSQLK